MGVSGIARKPTRVGPGRGAGFWGQEGGWEVAGEEGDGNPDTGLPTGYRELRGAMAPELGVRRGQPRWAGGMEAGHSTEEVMAEEAEN